MKRSGLLIALSWIVALGPGGHAAAQVAGSTRLGVAVEELKGSRARLGHRPAEFQRNFRLRVLVAPP